MHLAIGDRSHDLRHRALVIGILNRTPDSFYDGGAHLELDALVRRADELIEDGCDVVEVGGVKAGPGPEVGVEEELDRIVPAIAALRARFDVPVACDTWRAPVVAAAFAAGAVVGNDISGFSDPGYLPAAAAAEATVVATHIRLGPRIPDPEPVYRDVVAEVAGHLAGLAARAVSAGIAPERIVVDAGLDLGKTWEQSLTLLRASPALAELGYPLLLSASNKTFLGRLLDLGIHERTQASHAAHAVGVIGGVRLLRVHDVRGARRTADVLAAILAAREVAR